ncbi:hypothetical protein IAU59_001434 [Kwoniella sp. CBS 9459]
MTGLCPAPTMNGNPNINAERIPDPYVKQSPFMTLSSAASSSYRPIPVILPSSDLSSSSNFHATTTYGYPVPNLETGEVDTPKRRKLSPVSYEVSSPSGITTHPQEGRPLQYSQFQTYAPHTPRLPVHPNHHPTLPSTAALLFHAARSAHQASYYHLQQAFMPTTLKTKLSPASLTLPSYATSSSSSSATPFTHDFHAAAKALGLQLLALDFLRAGLAIPDLSESERVAFALEFGIIGLKVYTACVQNKGSRSSKGKGKSLGSAEAVDTAKLMGDLQDIVGQAYFIAQRQSSLERMRWSLELLNARLIFVQGKFNLGKRMIQQALTAKNPPSHRYALYLLYLESVEPTGSPDYLTVTDDLIVEAKRSGHIKVVQLLSLAKTRFIFVQRRWELASQALQALSTSIESPRTNGALPHDTDKSWRALLLMQYLFLRCLWDGRIGNDESVKALLKRMYAVMDQASSEGTFYDMKANGGIASIDIPGDRPLIVQTTPPNILYLLTYLTTATSRRDFSGSDKVCKSILYLSVLRQTEHQARIDDMWDCGFSLLHGVGDTLQMRRKVMSMRAEIMLEYATALLFRSRLSEGYQTLHEVVNQLRALDAFQPYSPHVCLLFGQHANLLGIDRLATRYYEACKTLINPNSELSLTAEICLIGCQNHLSDITNHPQRQATIDSLADKCKSSSSAMLTAAGNFLASLTDENRVSSKKSLSAAYEITRESNNNVLRLLIFAFTTSTHHYGGRERMFRQLETGRDLAKLMGGKDREDGVGSVILGLWFALHLKDHFRQEGLQDMAVIAKKSVSAHTRRLEEVKVEAGRLRESLLAVCGKAG